MVLVVDDHEDMRYLLVRTLALDGYQAVAVSGGTDALAYLMGNTPQLIVLDYNMPDMDGLTVLSQIRKDPRLAKIPVIMFSADDGPAMEKARKTGVDAYVVKGSLDWAELRREIVRLIGPGDGEQTLPRIEPLRPKDVG